MKNFQKIFLLAFLSFLVFSPFSSKAAPTVVTTGDATVAANSVTLTGVVSNNDSYRFEYKITTSSQTYPSATDYTVDGLTLAGNQITKVLQTPNILANTNYTYRLGALENYVWIYGAEKQFKTGVMSTTPTTTLNVTVDPSDTSAGLHGIATNVPVGIFKLSLLTIKIWPTANPTTKTDVVVDWSSNTSASTAGSSLYFTGAMSGLTPLTSYTVFVDPTGATTLSNTNTTTVTFTTLAAPAGQTAPTANTVTDYYPIASVPNIGQNCAPDPLNKNNTVCVPTSSPSAFGTYLNSLIKIIIGISAILAFIMIVIGGLQYMTSELISSKEAGKDRITNAIIGLLIALGSFALLNTINPKLLDISLNIPKSFSTLSDFQIPGGLSYNGQPIKVKFNTEAYPAAKIASEKTGVSIAFILAIFQQETASGANVGRCFPDHPNSLGQVATMPASDVTALQTITSAAELNLVYSSVPVSCDALGGHGGAIGYTQFRPSTWISQRIEAQNYLGHMPSPWNAADAIMVEAVYLKKLNGTTDEYNAACKYYSGSACLPNRTPPNQFYGDEVMGKKLSIQAQIDAAIKSGDILP